MTSGLLRGRTWGPPRKALGARSLGRSAVRLTARSRGSARSSRSCSSCWRCASSGCKSSSVRKLAASQYNPRHAQIAVGRGSILASNGAPLAVTRGEKRVYPQGALVAQAVGYASARYGTSGLEDTFDRALTAHTDAVDPLTQLREIFAGKHGAPRGADIVTTLDLTVQKALVAGLSRHARAAGIVLDPRTGAVIALASIPSYDPNGLDAHWTVLSHNPASPLLDRSTGGLYPPGSTFKIVTAADALDAGVITPQSTFSDYGGFTVGNFTVHNDEEEVTGTQDLAGAFALSSNVDFAQIALKIGVDTWFQYAQKWGLGAAGRVRSAGDARPPAAEEGRVRGDPRAARLRPGVAAGHADAHGADRRDDRA